MKKQKQIKFIRHTDNQEGVRKFNPFEYYTVEESLQYIDCSIDELYRLISINIVPVKQNENNSELYIKGVDLLNLCRNEDGHLVYLEESLKTPEQEYDDTAELTKLDEQVTITVQPNMQVQKPVKKVIPHISEKGKQIMELTEFLGKNGISIPANKREKEAVIFKISELMSNAASSLKLISSLDFNDD